MLDIGEVEIHREWRGLIGELVVSWLLKVRPQETRVKTLARSCVSEIPCCRSFHLGAIERGNRYREMVQCNKGLWVHQARRRGQGRFVHISAVHKAGYDGLAEGAKISFEIVSNRGKESAENLRVG